MPADTYTPRLGLIEQGTGNNNNAWGDIFNASFALMVDRAIAGCVLRADTGGTLDLSGSPPPAGASQAIDFIQRFTGALVSNLTVIMPNLSKSWMIDNATSGAFQLFIKAGAGGTVVQIPKGCSRMVWCDGAGTMRREDADAVGTIRSSGANNLPFGGLSCDGSSKLRADFPDLFSVIGTTWGAVDGTHFTLPNMQDTGRFIRSSIPGILNVGNYQSNLVGAHTHTITGAPGIGTLGTSDPGNHTHANTLSDLGHTHNISAGPNTMQALASGTAGPSAFGGGSAGIRNVDTANGGVITLTNNTTPMSISNVGNGAHTHTFTGALSVGTLATAANIGVETRPETIVLYASILY